MVNIWVNKAFVYAGQDSCNGEAEPPCDDDPEAPGKLLVSPSRAMTIFSGFVNLTRDNNENYIHIFLCRRFLYVAVIFV